MSFKYEIGDEVRIKENFLSIESRHVGINDIMPKYANKISTIIKKIEYPIGHYEPVYAYRLEIDKNWVWDEVWLEDIKTVEDVQDNELMNIFEI